MAFLTMTEILPGPGWLLPTFQPHLLPLSLILSPLANWSFWSLNWSCCFLPKRTWAYSAPSLARSPECSQPLSQLTLTGSFFWVPSEALASLLREVGDSIFDFRSSENYVPFLQSTFLTSHLHFYQCNSQITCSYSSLDGHLQVLYNFPHPCLPNRH